GEVLSQHKLISVILSDVPGDDPQSIGSAPTIPDLSTYKEAFQILKRFSLWEKTPHSVRIHISKGMHGDMPENPQSTEQVWTKHRVEVISGAKTLVQTISKALSEQGFNIKTADEAYDEELRKISKKMCSEAISVLSKNHSMTKPAALIYFGESTVEVKGDGKGGRNQELALNAAISIEGQHAISLLSLGTDGMDGPTDAAGAIINSETALLARKQKVNPEEYLQKNDSYHFHEKLNTLVKTGPTGNNLMDIQVILVG
ncbi:MAG: MOFRL family protein, partial [Balneolaceae bacterium]